MWCRPEPSSVSPIYIPGRFRTASRPFSTLMDSAPYRSAPLVFLVRPASSRSSRRPLSRLILTRPFWGFFAGAKDTPRLLPKHVKSDPTLVEKNDIYQWVAAGFRVVASPQRRGV